jgi:hypothetical protein
MMNFEKYAKRYMPDTKWQILYDSIFMIYLECKLRDRKWIRSYQDLEGKGVTAEYMHNFCLGL